MKINSDATAIKALANIPPLSRDIRSPGAWRYFINYVMLGSTALIILIEMIDSGVWRRLWFALVLIGMAISNLAGLQAAERKAAKPDGAPNGSPARPVANSRVPEGPPSVT